jgi:hypothetical protein
MTIVDAKGRVFGTINLIDLAATGLLVFAAGLAVAAYRVFEIPAPAVERIEPATIAAGSAPRVRLIGRHFRHYLQAFVSRTGEPLTVTTRKPGGSPATIASVADEVLELQLPELEPGSYDVYLFDNARQVAYRPAALTVTPPLFPRAIMTVVVRLFLPPGMLDLIHVGDRDLLKPSRATAPIARPAEIVKIDVRAERAEQMELRIARFMKDDHFVWLGTHGSQAVADATLRVPLLGTAPGRWEYNDRTIRAGEEFLLATASYKVRGLVVSVGEPEALP